MPGRCDSFIAPRTRGVVDERVSLSTIPNSESCLSPTVSTLEGCALPDAGAGADDDRDPHGSTCLFIRGAVVCYLRFRYLHVTIATR